MVERQTTGRTGPLNGAGVSSGDNQRVPELGNNDNIELNCAL